VKKSPCYLQGSVVLAGHSLGGVILFELLRRGHSLSCTPQVGEWFGTSVFLSDLILGGRSNLGDSNLQTLKKIYDGYDGA